MEKTFLVSVARAIMRDPNTGAGLGYGTANIDSALTMTTEEAEVRGGINNPILYVYKHSIKVAVSITDATFSKNILSFNAGTNIYNGLVTALAPNDCKTLSASGSATLDNTPIGNVEVFFEDGTVQTVTPVGDTITVSGGENLKITAFYNYSVTADRITIETQTPPSVVDLTLIAEVRDDTNVITEYLQIRVPRFQVSGNYTLSLTANGVSNQALEGTALEVAATDCTTNAYYAEAIWIPATSVAPPVYALALTPDLTFSVAAGLPSSKPLTLNGLRGGNYTPTNLTTSGSYAVTTGSTTLAAYFNVGLHTGLVTAGSSVAAGWTAIVTASYVDATHGLLHDYITLTATA
jgi:hypothetical protein